MQAVSLGRCLLELVPSDALGFEVYPYDHRGSTVYAVSAVCPGNVRVAINAYTSADVALSTREALADHFHTS